MNINKIHQRWPVSCRDSLAAIDRMSVSDALELGLITKEECDVITEEFVTRATMGMETKGYATAEDLHPVSKSEIVKRFREGRGQIKPDTGCE